ncbi:LysR family transcriptional regulator [Methylobacterium radiotolerans]|uniref:DoxX family protein n=1 Tax=Methylobacterium radiotolerans TaxID=31998 RepID=UPI00041BA3B2|nr:DoxX family protein [Methylobacterium radiotolerans]KTS11186.1 LysR family transcriptional regulator [Methylobacterium radiotolerans]KTS45037.1 LysR family transcriptional regulator [Methylobacterium radiotolerans]KZC02733.1 Inner membrane protein YqjF [Methylobacterium radiotolerans]MBY0250731.1 DoxX family protein [Methylobacterium organophilum]
MSPISSSSATALLPVTGRVLMSAIFLVSGAGKLAAPAATLATIEAAHLPLPPLAYAAATVVEVVGGLLLVAGYRTRPVALVLALFAVATAVTFHAALGDQNQMFHFLKNLAMAGGLLQVAAFGAGPLSLDARQGRA